MLIYKKEYNFFASTWASGEIADLCPGGQLENLGEFLSEQLPQKQFFENVSKLAVILNKADIMRMHFASGKPISELEHIEPISAEILLSLSVDEFLAVQREVMNALERGTKTSVDVAPDAKNAESGAEA